MSRRTFLLAPLLALPLAAQAQPPLERIHAGFRTLSTGSWDDALREWTRTGTWTDGDGKMKRRLEAWVSSPRNVGQWESVNPPYLTRTWQRHWLVATFDSGAVFFAFDFVFHKGEWRMVDVQASPDPQRILPDLDLLPAALQRRD